MIGFILPATWKILQWALIAALVSTYIEIGVGGDSLNAIVQSIKEVLINIQWAELIHSIVGHLQVLIGNVWDGIQNNIDLAQTKTVAAQCTETLKECNQVIQHAKN